MGIVGVIGAVVSTVATVSAQRKQASALEAQAEQQKLANQIGTASQVTQDRLARRRAAREERVRRARIISSGVTSGGAGGSGLFGSLSALTGNFDAALADQAGQRLASKGISAANQRAADFNTEAQIQGAKINQWRAFSGLVDSAVDFSKTLNS